MIVNLIKSEQIFNLILPTKVKGQYWLTDIDSFEKPRKLISIEANKGEWVVKSNKIVSILNKNNEVVQNTVLKPTSFFNLRISDTQERIILFTEKIENSRFVFNKYIIDKPMVFNIGRTNDNNVCFENKLVSSKHAKLVYDGHQWSITDLNSTNGTYVNGYRVMSQGLKAGDLIYIMGLKIIIGSQYFAINNPDGLLHLNIKNIIKFIPQKPLNNLNEFELPKKEFFYRSPRFLREIKQSIIQIDSPPQMQKVDTVPMALMLGPSLTMGLTSLSTGLLSFNNIMSNGGNITQALPTLMMSLSMLLGTVLWPILTKRYEKKTRIKNEKKRQEKYLAYLDKVRDEIKKISKEQSHILETQLVSLDECANRIHHRSSNLWERMIGQSDFLRLRLGLGNLPLKAEIKYAEKKFSMEEDALQDAMQSLGNEPKELKNVPISISFIEDFIVGIYGTYNNAVLLVKTLILQMIALHSYDELKIVFITEEYHEQEWEFIKWIPHFWNDDKTIRFFASNADDMKELSVYIEKNILSRKENNRQDYSEYSPYYIIITTGKEINERYTVLSQLLKYKNNCGFSILMMTEKLRELPKETKIVISADEEQSKIFNKNDTTGKEIAFKADKLGEINMNNIAEEIANIELDLSSQRYILPHMITFLEMFNVSKIEHLNSLTRWKENNPTITLQTPIGVGTTGELFNLDLHEKYHGPHGLVAGMTGSGKSEFIITYILSLAVNYHPDEVAFILIDYKGGGLTGAFEDEERGIKLPHLAGTITNLDGASIKRSLISIQSELRRRQSIFNEARKISNEGTMDIYKYQQLYRDKIVDEPVPHLFIISDEFAELKAQQPDFMDQLISAARIGRSLGVHLILATQKPSGVVDDQIWSNSKFRVCLKVQEKADSQDMIKCPDAAELSQTGRFYLQVGFNELFALGQSAWCGAEYIPTETIEKEKDDSIQIVDHLGRTIMNVKSNKKRKNVQQYTSKQIVAIVKYLSDLAIEENVCERPLWLPPIPDKIYITDIENQYYIHPSGNELNPVVGIYDDPFNQKQGALTIPFSEEGNCLLYGSTGSGKTTFLTTLCYSLIKNYQVQELNLYIMDFGSETLKVFEKAPQTGGVILAEDEEKTINIFKMLQKEIDYRKNLFSQYGGDYKTYCKNTRETIPNILVVLNNYSGFAEQYENLIEELTLLTREGIKYGIYFIVTANSTNAVRYRTSQNFKMMLTMQLNDASDYSMIVGKTDGLIPSKYKGRGLVHLDRVYEFQTAHVIDVEDELEYIRHYCDKRQQESTMFAKRIPILPKIINYEYMKDHIYDLTNIPVGILKQSLREGTICLSNKVIYPIVTQDIYQTGSFIEEFVKVIHKLAHTIIVDVEQLLFSGRSTDYEIITNSFETWVIDVFNDMVTRNNTYKDAKMDISSLNGFEEKIYIILGVKKLFEQLTLDGKEKLNVLIEKAESIYKLRFVFVETSQNLNIYSYEEWYKRHILGTEGLWIGDGIADQYLLKVNKVTSELYEEIGDDYGYLLVKSRPLLIKLLTSKNEGDETIYG